MTRCEPDCDGGDYPREAHRVEDQMSAVWDRSASSSRRMPSVREPGPHPRHPTDPPARTTLSDQALRLVDGPRAKAYGQPEGPTGNMARIGMAWAAILGNPAPVPAWKVALMLSTMKNVRAAETPEDDSLVDSVGYLEIVRRTRP